MSRQTTGGSVHNAGNQLTEDAQFTYEYDANGNQTKKTSKATNNFTVQLLLRLLRRCGAL